MPNLRYSPWVFSQGCARGLKSINACRPSLYSVVQTQRVLHHGTCTREPERKQRCKERSPRQELASPWLSVPRGDDVLRTEKQRLCVISSQTYSLLLRLSLEERWIVFDRESNILYLIGHRCKFSVKNENVWMELDINLPGYSKYHLNMTRAPSHRTF